MSEGVQAGLVVLRLQNDSSGNLTQKTDPRGVVTNLAYDAFDRTTTIDYSDTPAINPDVKWFYDGATTASDAFGLSTKAERCVRRQQWRKLTFSPITTSKIRVTINQVIISTSNTVYKRSKADSSNGST